MSVRITQSILYAQSLRDMHRSQAGSVVLQEQIASGRRVNRPSDDPAATLRILPLHAEIKDLDQMLDNEAIARESLTSSTGALQEGSELLQRVRELVVQAANGTNTQGERDRIGDEVEQLLQQMVGIGNSKRGSHYLFGGTKTDTQPFTLTSDGGGTRVRYGGDHGAITIEVAPGVKSTINLPGDSIFQHRVRGATTIDGTTGARPSGASDSGVGFDNLQASFAGLGGAPSTVSAGSGTTTALGALSYVFTAAPATLAIGGGPAVAVPATNQDFTTSDGRKLNLSVTGVPGTLTGSMTSQASLSIDGGQTTTTVDFTSSTVQVNNSFEDTVLNLDVSQLARTGTDLVKYPGTFDVFTVLSSVRDLLQNPRAEPDQKVGARLSAILGEIDSAHDGLLAGLQGLGHKGESMEMLQSRVSGLKITTQEGLSRIEDTDIAEAILAYNHQQLTYQAALQVSGRILQTSLLDFLR